MDIELFYREYGKGIPFVFIHGNGENSDGFEKYALHFSNKYRTIRIDTRGHGRSPRGTAPFTISQFASDLYSFFITKKIESAVIFGFSDGANIAMEFAIAHPNMVRALILNSGNMTPCGLKRRFLARITRQYLSLVGQNFLTEESARKRELLSLMVNEPELKPSDLSKITAPTLVIAGNDDLISAAETARIARAIPNSCGVTLVGHHDVCYRRPEVFISALESFLKNV